MADLAQFDAHFNPSRYAPAPVDPSVVASGLLVDEEALANKVPRKHRKPLPCIVIDTQEGLPYTFDPDEFTTERKSLVWGDYSIRGYETSVVVERKSLDDWIKTNRFEEDRFHRELTALSRYWSACVGIEATVEDVLKHRYEGSTHPHAVIGYALAIEVDFGVPCFFWGSRPIARWMTERRLLKAWKRLSGLEKEKEKEDG
jgi:DNA excision repair protein ERCC-4